MKEFFKRVFCKHTFNFKMLVTTQYQNGNRYRIYRCACTKCGKEVHEKEIWY